MQVEVLTTTMLVLGLVLVTMALVEHPVRRLPLSASLVYLAVGWLVVKLGAPLAHLDPQRDAGLLVVVSEWAVLVSLFGIGLRLKLRPGLPAWRIAINLATAGLLATIALAAVAAQLLLGLDWRHALLLGAILAPTDPVLASEVQSRSETDRDAMRVSLSAEGALNDGTAFPVVMLALGWLGLHELGPAARDWLLRDLLWSVLGGAVLGWLLGRALGWGLGARPGRERPLGWDELLFLGSIALAYALASLLAMSTFLVTFVAGATMLMHGRGHRAGERVDAPTAPSELSQSMVDFGDRCGRLIEVTMVIFIGAALASLPWRWECLAFALTLIVVVRPLAVYAVIRRRALPRAQRRLVAWFGIRGVGSVFYLAYVLRAGVHDSAADILIGAVLMSIALSVVMHGISATPLMQWYQRRRG
jgi:NhaP-type Na+/H+ or K+/H+ antiporter